MSLLLQLLLGAKEDGSVFCAHVERLASFEKEDMKFWREVKGD